MKTLLAILLAAALPATAKTLTYTDLIHQLTDLDRLTHVQAGVTGGQYSSWDRSELDNWGANGDAGQYLRVDPNGEAVMMDQDGPGCIYRVWSANPQGKIRIYLDGAATPVFESDFIRLFTGDQPPFIQPLVWKREGVAASDCYVPIPFSKHIKIVADARHGQYYHFNYLKFPADWQVPGFSPNLSEDETAALKVAAEYWGRPGVDPKPSLPGQATIAKTITLQPGQTIVLADLAGPGMVRAIRAKVNCPQRGWPRKLVLKGTWDGAAWPQVLSPLGPFFGYDWTAAEYTSLIAGCREGNHWFYYPMPFRRTGRLELSSYASVPAEVEYEVAWAPAQLADDTCYFYARWRSEKHCATFDYPFVETAGTGHFVGMTLQIDHPLPGWWGEGDEKAWGIRFLPGPSWGCSYDSATRTCPFRWHFMDLIPFTQRFRMTIENYGVWDGNTKQEEYNSVGYWYQKELTPPFAELNGKTYVGADRPGVKPGTMAWRSDTFRDITPADLRNTGADMPFCLEAEDLLTGGAGKIVGDQDRDKPFNGEQAVDYGHATAGQVLGDLVLSVDAGTVYYPRIITAGDAGAAELTLELEGERLAAEAKPAANQIELAGVFLAAGPHKSLLVATSAGRAVVDCFQLPPARRERGAIEAEELTVAGTTHGAEAPHTDIMRGVSAGRVRGWHAAAEGQGLRLQLPEGPARSYVLGLRPMYAPECGIIQAFVAGKPVGPTFDLYDAAKHPGPAVLPLGPLPAGDRDVELRVVGKNAKSGGYRVGMDYFRWEPLIIHPAESTPGVWAMVSKTDACGYEIQNLGDAWLGGHHLWVQPSYRQGAFIEITANVPSDGKYEVVVRYTTSWDYARVQAALDGKPLGQPVDCWSEQVLQTKPLTLGSVDLTAGPHVLRFTAAGKNERSKGFLMGLDYITIRK
ncbi:MAG: DUF2961 domain-containing protein [Armatimonadetes bacterium]|nr:DUF2961 domain-containing protein [Armatimonadota bacterium]